MFQNYEKYIINNGNGNVFNIQRTVEGVSGCFNFTKYIEDSPSDQKIFFKYFLKLQMFTRHLERKLWPSKNEDIIDVTFFDEHIKHKYSKVKPKAKGVSFLKSYNGFISIKRFSS